MKKVFLKDYQSPDFEIEKVQLFFDLHAESAFVTAQMQFKKIKPVADLFLDGEELKLVSIELDGKTPSYDEVEKGLIIKNVPDSFSLKTKVELKPQLNTALEGLYKSNGLFVTQCEAQGFRRVTYFMDRPDVMTNYEVTIEADKAQCPWLLSNGDCVSRKDLGNGRHQAVWKDPFKKPCYLFALVAGDMGVIKDTFTTSSGKKVSLEIYAPHGKQERCGHAMESLKKSMKWDEERFGREYDLATYMIVSIDDFNAGAMENKGLNVFNSRLVLADPQTATDADYDAIESVIAHEYFHNWTGNRVTLRDWFHLSLKEGLTVFRDQEFSMDQSSRAMVRIDNVDGLRNWQFSEDAGPNAHPIRPASCFAVDNFFTSTIYEKGSEVIRMMQTMVGRPGFRKGMDLYFERHDGQAVIIEDFAKAIAEPNHQDWSQFKLWYSQAGTPTVTVLEDYSPATKTYTLELSQDCPQTSQEKAEGITKQPFHIPLVVGLLGKDGKDLPLKNSNVAKNTEGQDLIHLKKSHEKLVFENIPERPVLSLNRQFSAPIHLKWNADLSTLLFLMQNDSDAFNRWESSQKIYINTLRDLIHKARDHKSLPVDAAVPTAFLTVVTSRNLDSDLKAKLMSLPQTDYLSQLEPVFDAVAFKAAQDTLLHSFSTKATDALLDIYKTYHGKNEQSRSAIEFGHRRLKNKALSYLSLQPQFEDLVWNQFSTAKIMTDQQAAFGLLLESNTPQPSRRDQAIQEFYTRWKSEFLVLTKWFALQASADHEKTFETVVGLTEHPDFNLKTPTLVYSVISRFGENLLSFHNPKHDTYTFLADKILEVDKLNPQVAARCASGFDMWIKLPTGQKEKAHAQIERLVRTGLSSNTHEILSKALQAT